MYVLLDVYMCLIIQRFLYLLLFLFLPLEPNKELTTSNVIRLLRKTEFRFSKNWRGVARELGVSLEKRSQQDSRLQLHSNIEAGQ